VAEFSFSVADWRAWAPGLETLQAWKTWAGGLDSSSSADSWPIADNIPMMLRRRAGPLGQKAIAAALGCQGASRSRYIFASRHGELGRTVGILGTVAEGEIPSPAEFSMSVHHAIAGLLSIHTENRQGHTAIAAGVDTFGFGLLEALSLIAADPQASALLVYYDASLPVEYGEFDSPNELLPLVLALKLEAANANVASYKFQPRPTDRPGERTVVETTRAPLDFLRLLLTGADLMTSAGERMNWQWRRVH
jgi:hypothetical protein